MKDKVEQVQMMLQQRRQRRKARRAARASPYAWQPVESVAEGGEACDGMVQNKEGLEAIRVSSTCEEHEKEVRDAEAEDRDGTFPSELKPEAVLV